MSDEHNITLRQACEVWVNLPEWIRIYEDIRNPMFLGTGSVEGDEEVRANMIKALGLNRIQVTVAGPDIDKHIASLVFDMAVKAYLYKPKQP